MRPSMENPKNQKAGMQAGVDDKTNSIGVVNRSTRAFDSYAESVGQYKYRDSCPAFQEYASDMLSNGAYRMMSLGERGLLHTLRLECWVNFRVPSDPTLLARFLGLPETEIHMHLGPLVMKFFREDDEHNLYSPDLEKYRAKLIDTREKQAAAAEATNAAREKKKQEDERKKVYKESKKKPQKGSDSLERPVERTVLSRVEQSRAEPESPYQGIKRTVDREIEPNYGENDDPFVNLMGPELHDEVARP